MNNLTKRQQAILKIIIDEYTLLALPVGSHVLNDKYLPDLSSATIRNEMMALEKFGLISKCYSSAGRTPTLSGYRYYNEFLSFDIPESFKTLLRDLLSKRNLSIDQVINKSVEIIHDMTNLPTVLTELYPNDLLKKVELVSIDLHKCLFILITSSGKILKEEISFDKEVVIDDLIICVNIFNDRLIDTPMNEIESKLDILKDLIRSKIKSHEFVIQEIVEKIFRNID